MPHNKDEVATFEVFEQEIQKLESLYSELGIEIPTESNLASASQNAFKAIYYSVFPSEAPTAAEDADTHLSALAGLADLAAKINRARATPGFDMLRPHLANMLQGAVRMNARSPSTDAAGNKNSELYVACLALGGGMTEVELEDPVRGADGKNPDVFLKRRDHSWSIAVKTIHSAKPPSIFANIEKAVEQIERSGRDGIVFINLKNIINDEHAAPGPFSSPDKAVAVLLADIDAIVRGVQSEIVDQDWIQTFAGKRARPVVAFMAQRTVVAAVPGVGLAPVAVKTMRVSTFPPASDNLTGIDAEAFNLLEELNDELLKNPPSD
ncbi:MAG: hypothetical protein WC829_03810 [Hyphomicrobium sp.]|jgi:hypothetical protein